jgi:hypothetical protein
MSPLALHHPPFHLFFDTVSCLPISPLERLLRCESSLAHLAIAEALWAAQTAEEAVASLQQLAESSKLDGKASINYISVCHVKYAVDRESTTEYVMWPVITSSIRDNPTYVFYLVDAPCHAFRNF